MKHIHHIIPKHMGGTDDRENLVELTIEEHALAHKGLYEKYGKWQDKIAWKALSGQIGKQEIIQEIIRNSNKSRIVSQETRELIRNYNLGKKHSDETKIKMSEIRKINPPRIGPHNEQTKKKISEKLKGVSPPNKGKLMTEEQKKKISDSKKGKKQSEETKKRMSIARKKYWENKKEINNV